MDHEKHNGAPSDQLRPAGPTEPVRDAELARPEASLSHSPNHAAPTEEQPTDPEPHAVLTRVEPTLRLERPSIAGTLPPPAVDVLPTPSLRLAPDTVSALAVTPAPMREAQAAPVRMFDRDRTGESVSHRDTAPVFANASAVAVDRVPQPPRASLGSELSAATDQRHGSDAAAQQPKAAPLSFYAKSAAKFAVYAVIGWFALIAVLILAYRFVNPPMSSLMLQQWISGQAIAQTWVDIDNISPHVVRAVLLSEDGRFCDHTGVDFDAMQDAIEKAGDGAPRGASTISMQVTKNLFLWPSKSYVRKAIEIPLTWATELVWPKSRIMEIYMNIAEWGPGIFGVEAASQFHFQKSARRLNEREAAQLAVALPNPYMRDAGDPGPKTRRLASDIQSRMRNAYASQTSCVIAPGTLSR